MPAKQCNKCFLEKPIEQFYPTGNGEHRRGACIACIAKQAKARGRPPMSEKAKASAVHRMVEWQRTPKGKIKSKRNQLARFGLTLEQFNDMVAAQNALCAICGRPESGTCKGTVKCLAVDHNHETGQVRQLLCGHCNRALGLFQEDPKLLHLAAAYLVRHTTPIQGQPEIEHP